MGRSNYSQFIRFLQEDLAISASSIDLAERACGSSGVRNRESDPIPLPMVLWQYGLVTIKQLERIFDWLEAA
jgi:hypothetical protein